MRDPQSILPTGDIKIQDGQFTSNKENYKEFWYAMVGLAGESQNFDGNGHYVRFQVGGGSQTISTGKYGGNGGEQAVRPTSTRRRSARGPPTRASARRTTPRRCCKDQKLPDLNGAKTGPADGGGGAPPDGTARPRRPRRRRPGVPTVPSPPRAPEPDRAADRSPHPSAAREPQPAAARGPGQ